ncbi:MAG: glycosyltransferase, partial [Gemmatimonadota bacterium]
AYAGATVGINIHQSIDPDPAHDSRACNQRLFELAAIGVAQVVDKRGDLPLHFEEGTEVLVFENPAELKGLVKRALHEDGYRERLHANARQRAMRDHTYMHRMLTLLEVVMPVVGAAGKGAKARSEK